MRLRVLVVKVMKICIAFIVFVVLHVVVSRIVDLVSGVILVSATAVLGFRSPRLLRMVFVSPVFSVVVDVRAVVVSVIVVLVVRLARRPLFSLTLSLLFVTVIGDTRILVPACDDPVGRAPSMFFA